MAGIAALPDDVLFEVFSCVHNVKALFRCAATCRRWLRLVTDRDFLRRLWRQQDLLLGFFLNAPKKRRGKEHKHASASPLTFVPTTLTSPVGSVDCAHGVRFPPRVDDDDSGGICYFAEHLASRRGVLLVRFLPCRFVEEERRTRFRFGLCDPITGAHEFLPELECARHDGCYEYGYAILTAADTGREREQGAMPPTTRHSLSSQVLVVDRHNYYHCHCHWHQCRHQWHVHAYSAVTRSWSAPTSCTHSDPVSLAGERAAVVHRGVAHWLCVGPAVAPLSMGNRDLYKLSVDAAASGRVSLTKLPIRSSGFPFFFVSRDDQRLSVACVCARTCAIDVWTRQEDVGSSNDDPAAWCRSRVIQIPVPMKWLQRNKWTMLATYAADENNVFALDLETGAMVKVLDLSQRTRRDADYYKYLPYKRDLSEFFARQLGGLYRVEWN